MIAAKERFARYLQRRYGDRSTPKHYLHDIEMFIQQVGYKAPERVTVQDIDQFVDEQRERGLKAATINRRVASLHTFFEYLASEEPEKAWPNPVVRRRHCLKAGSSLPRDAKEWEVDALFAIIAKRRDQALFGLMVGAGLRVGEVVTLRCDDLEPPASPEQGARLRVRGKGRKERVVWVTPHWYAVVQRWLGQRGQVENPHLFLNQHGRALSVAGVQYWLRHYCRQAGIHLSCHQLRHTFARRLAEQRLPTESIGQLLGHSQLKTTQRYTAGANPDLRDAFLETMSQLEATPPLPVAPTPPLPSARPAAEVADPQACRDAARRFDVLPAWLQPTLTAYLRHRWRNWQAHRAADNAASLSRQLVQIWQWLLANRAIAAWEALQRQDVEAWLEARQAAAIAVNTRCSQLTTLFGCLHFAADQGLLIAANIFRIPYPARPDPLPRYLTQEEYQRLWQTVCAQTDSDKPRDVLDRAWFLTLAHTGIRTCELVNLRLNDLDFASQRLVIRASKNYHDRVVFLTPLLTTALAHYLTVRPPVEDDHLWLDKGKPLLPARVRYCLQRWSQTAQVAASPHRLRHTLATQLVNQAMPLVSIAKLLGHRSLNTTQHYARLFEQTVKEQFEAAAAHIEGIAAPDWPRASPDLACTADSHVKHFTDSV